MCVNDRCISDLAATVNHTQPLHCCSAVVCCYYQCVVQMFACFVAWNVALQCEESYDVMRQLFVLCHDVSMYTLYFCSLS